MVHFSTAPQPQRVVIYARQSKGNKISIAQQISRQTADAVEQGWEIVATLTDSTSASKYATVVRADWEKVIDLLETGKADVLSLWNVARASRRATVWSDVLDKIEKSGVLVRLVGDSRTYNPKNDINDWHQLMNAAIAADVQARNYSKDSRRAISALADAGMPSGKVVFGYERVYTGDGFERHPHPQHSAHVKEAFTRYAKGQSKYEICQDLNRRGITTSEGNPWNNRNLGRLLENVAYIGKRVHQGQVHGKAAWAPLIDTETFNTCQERLQHTRESGSRDGTVKHLLTGIAVCGVCGDTVNRFPSQRAKPYYACRKGHTAITQDFLDDYVAQEVQDRLIKIRNEPRYDEKAISARDAARAKVAELETRLAELEDAMASGDLSAKVGGKVVARVEAELEAAQNVANAVVASRFVHVVMDDGASWYTMTLEQRRELIRNLMLVRINKVGNRKVPVEDRVDIEDRDMYAEAFELELRM